MLKIIVQLSILQAKRRKSTGSASLKNKSKIQKQTRAENSLNKAITKT